MSSLFRTGLISIFVAILSTMSIAQQGPPSLQVSLPADGTIVNPGQSVSVTVTSPAGLIFNDVALISAFGITPVDALSAQVSVMIPADIDCGPYAIVATGITNTGVLVRSQAIHLDVERADMPISLSSQFPALTFETIGQPALLTVFASFADGTVLDVTKSSNISYQSSNSSIVAVDSTGEAVAQSVGKSTITVAYSNPAGAPLQFSVPVTVLSPSVTVTPSSLNFGNVNVNSNASLSVTVTNNSKGDNSLNIKAVRLVGSYSESDNCISSSPLAVGGSCTVTVTFHPIATGQNSGMLNVTSSASSVPSFISLTGIGVIGGPVVTGISPAIGSIGSSIIITGSGFGATQGTSILTFNGVPASTIGAWSDSGITAIVPTGATTGNVVVTVGGVASNGTAFTVVTPPVIASLTPTSGVIGSSVVITGTAFGTTQGTSTVTFNGTAATTITSWGAASITAGVPAGATTGNVVVTVGGVASNGTAFTVVTPPIIASLTPTSGVIGSSVVIAGSNFGTTQGTSTVTFNGTAATTIGAWSATSVTAVVPTGATTGNVVVTVGGVASNGTAFTVVTPPAITSLSPISGVIGSSVAISGSAFGGTQGTSTVTFNGTTATTITSWSATSITAAVPTAATTGNVVVTVGGVASNGVIFTVSSGGISGFTRVQVKSRAIGSVGASSVTVGAAQGWASSTVGNAIIVICGAHTGAPVPTISDNKSDTYALLGSVTDSSPAVLAIYVLPNNPGGVTSITCTPHAFASMTETVMELNGAASSAVLDQVVGFDNAFGVANPWTSHSTAVQSTAGDYAIGVGYEFRLGGQTFTAGSGWTAVGADNAGTIFLEEQNTASGTSSIAATGNISTTANAQVLALAATIKPASGGGVPAPSITGLTPNSGAIGSSVVIAGSNFGTTQGTSTVSFNGTSATTVSSWSNTSVTAIVPTGSTTGNVVVTVGGVASNGVLFTVSSAGGSGFTRVQIKSKSIGSSGATSATVGSAQGWVPSTVGNAIIVACGTATVAPVPTISDNKSDTYTLIKSVIDSAPATLALYILPNNPGGVSSITCTPNAFSEMTIVVMELNGAASASATDQISGNDNAFGGANPWTSHSTAVQSTTGDYGIGVAYEFRLGNQTFTSGSGWTAVGGDNAGTIFFEEQNPVGGTSSIAATGSISTTTNAQVLAIAATIKLASGGH